MAYTNFTEGTLATRVRYLINEPSAFTVENQEIYNWFKQAAMEISKNKLVGRIKSFQMTQNDYEVAITGSPVSITDCYDIESIIFMGTSATSAQSTSRTLLKMHPRQIAHIAPVTAVATPKYWYYENGNLGIYPAISAASQYFTILYYALVSTWTSGTTPSQYSYLPDWAEEYMVWFAVSKYFSKIGKEAQANQYMSYFNKYLIHHRIDQYIKPVDSKDMLRLPDYTKVQ